MQTIKVYNLSNLPVANLNYFNELQDDFKLFNPEKNKKLQELILKRGFKYAFKAWQDETGKLWIIDAHQRKSALIELEKQGYHIPPIPYELIFAENKRDAVKEIAAYNSEFADKNPDTLLFQQYNISSEELEEFELKLIPVQLDDKVNWNELENIQTSSNNHENQYHIKYEIIFDNEGQQEKWYNFLKNLKDSYPECETIASRIIKYIEDHE